MESVNTVPDSMKSVNQELIAQCFKNTYTSKSKLKVNDPKSIFGLISKQLTNRNDSTLSERKFLHALWKKSIKVIKNLSHITIIFYYNCCKNSDKNMHTSINTVYLIFRTILKIKHQV